MAVYLRKRVLGGTYFFTAVTHQRRRILSSRPARECLREAFKLVRQQWPFEVVAVALLPDHLHTIWSLQEGDADYSLCWQKLKEHFTRAYLQRGGREGCRGPSRSKHGERGIWQRRFYEHTCRDDEELKECLDYLHWNPVKHGLVARVMDYPWSSFHRFVRLGEYPTDWGGENPCPTMNLPE